MNPAVKKAIEMVVKAIVELLVLILESKGGSGKEVRASEWPKNFSLFRKHWEGDNAERSESFLADFFKRCSAVTWTPEKVQFNVMGEPEFEASACHSDFLAMVKTELNRYLGFDGELFIVPANATNASATEKAKTPPAKNTAGKKEAKPVVTAEHVQKACVELADQLGDKNIVRDLLKAQFGSTKVAEIPAAKYPDVLAALKNYGETSTAESTVDEEGF